MATDAPPRSAATASKPGVRWFHVGAGLLTALFASLFAWAVPAIAGRLVPPRPGATVAGIPPIPADLHSIAPGSILHDPGGRLIYAGAPEPVDSAPADTSTPSESPTEATPPGMTTPPEGVKIIAADLAQPWLVSELPKGVPQMAYEGWVRVKADALGIVSSAEITKSTGNPAVDAASLKRLKRDRLRPARKELPDGATIDVPYAGAIYIRWVTGG